MQSKLSRKYDKHYMLQQQKGQRVGADFEGSNCNNLS